MKNTKTLILLTNYYPFYKGEEYLENEIDIASSHYDNIYIFATMASEGMTLTRKVPQNVTVIKCGLNYGPIARVKMLLSKSEIKCYDAEPVNLLQTLYRRYFFGRVKQVLNCIKKNTIWEKILESESLTVYSYWLHITASVAVRLTNWLQKEDKKVLCIARAHRYDLYEYASPLKFIPDRKYMMNHMNYIFPCSKDGETYLQNKYPEYCQKIKTAKLGTIKEQPICCTRKPLFEMISCSGIRKIKRLDRIINVVKILSEDMKLPVHWTHIGDGEYKETIEKLAKKKLKKDTYTFVGRLSNREVIEYYSCHKCSLFLNLSDSEGVPVAIMEAIGRGIPVVATDVGGTREIVDNGENGYLISDCIAEIKIAKIIKNIMEMETHDYYELCKKSLEKWTTEYDAIPNYENFYSMLKAVSK